MAHRCSLVHFETPCERSARASAFHTDVVGRTMQTHGPETRNDPPADTTRTEDAHPIAPGHINSGAAHGMLQRRRGHGEGKA